MDEALSAAAIVLVLSFVAPNFGFGTGPKDLGLSSKVFSSQPLVRNQNLCCKMQHPIHRVSLCRGPTHPARFSISRLLTFLIILISYFATTWAI